MPAGSDAVPMALYMPELSRKGRYRVHAVSALETGVVPASFEKALRTIRSAMAEMELEIIGEFEMDRYWNGRSEWHCTSSKILLVDSPLLIFEALALDRAAAVFLPLHVLVSKLGETTEVSFLNPLQLFDARFPVGVAEPMDRLMTLVALSLQSVSTDARTASSDNGRIHAR